MIKLIINRIKYFFLADILKGLYLTFRNGLYFIDNDLMLNDSYPNNENKYPLYVYNFNKNICFKLYTFNSTPCEKHINSLINWDNSALRCDLHPKWSFDGKLAIVDTVQNGSRQIFVYDVNKILEQND